jgi:PadR family transcriptional regulator, regulatory protein PadR
MPRSNRLISSLSSKEALILDLLRGAKERYGLELVAASDGALKRGTIYVTLGRMENKGYVVSRVENETPSNGGLPRRLYTATPHGRQVLSALTAAGRRLTPGFAR